jgi:hypothetical protein
MFLVIFITKAQAQGVKVQSFTSAYTVLNPTIAAATPATTYTGNASYVSQDKFTAVIPGKSYDKRWLVGFGIPLQVALDYAYLRSRMVTAYEENPEPYNNGSQALKEAVDILGWSDFATISSWAPVRCQFYFRFIPPLLGEKESYKTKYSYQFNPMAAPVKGSLTFWIR